MYDLEHRIGKLEKSVATFAAELRHALGYVRSDAGASLTKTRIVMEKLLVSIFEREMGHEPRKPMLGDMLIDNQFSRKIERRILSRMNAIRDMTNLGAHGETVKPEDAVKALDDLCVVLDWYLQRYVQNVIASEPPAATAPSAPMPPKRRKLFALVAVVVVAVGVGAVAWLAGRKDDGVQPAPEKAAGPVAADERPGQPAREEPAEPVNAHRGPSRPAPAPDTKTTLRVLSLDVVHFKRLPDNGAMKVGTLGNDSFATTLGDQVELSAKLSTPAYAYLLAFDPDGKIELCFPADENLAPPLTDHPSYPSTPGDVRYGLTDGAGLMAFAVVASSEPLPPYREWGKKGLPTWSTVPAVAGEVWWSDGIWLEAWTPSGRRRSKDEKALGSSPAIYRLTAGLKNRGPDLAIGVIGFAVGAKPKP
jgi:hypothetical protein